jgi:UDP-2,3-diacylglucosamine pyrophosphatase LpxH
MDLVRIASDWHLAPRSPPAHGRLAVAFLRRARADGASVILNGDVFDDLFAGAGRGARAHPDVVAELERLRGEGRLRRLRGNHDPAGGEERAVLEWAAIGRVIVTHGDGIDPLHRSWLGRLGHALSLRAGAFPLVRLAMALAEGTARALVGRRILRGFRTRCAELVAREACALGVFGHVHARHLAPGDRYANAGWLHGGRLEYLELGPDGARLAVLTIEEVAEERVAPR